MPLEPLRQDQNSGVFVLSQQEAHSYQSGGMTVTGAITPSNCPTSQNGVRKKSPTCTLGSGGEGRPWWSRAPFPWSREQYPDLILHIRVQVPQLIVGRVDDVGLCPGAGGGTVLHLLQDDGAVSNDGVGIRLDPQVCGPHSQQLWGGDGCGRL